MEIDVIAQVAALRLSELLRIVSCKTERIFNKIITEKKKHVCSSWHFCTAAAGSSWWLKEKEKQQVGCFVIDYTATEEKATCLSLLPCIIYSLPPQLLAEMYYCTISPSFALTFDDLYSINNFALLDAARNELNCLMKQLTKLILARRVLSLVHWNLQTFPLYPLFLVFAVWFCQKLIFSPHRTECLITTRCICLPLSSTWMSGF